MLIIYSNLVLGGIETFFVRLCEQRHIEGKTTKVLLLFPAEMAQQDLLKKLEKVASIYYLKDIAYFTGAFFARLPLLNIYKKKSVSQLFQNISQIHVSSGSHALLANKLSLLNNSCIPITIGVYHSKEFTWNKSSLQRLPYFEQINRKFFTRCVDSKNLLFFSADTKDYYEKYFKLNFHGAQTFRLGVISRPTVKKDFKELNKIIRIYSVGRLVSFKQYNLWMIDVIKNLKDMGINVTYDIYGTGPLMQSMDDKIKKLELSDSVKLKGALPYNSFDEVSVGYDLFVGSGTAIIQASSVGIPSIIGIESEDKSLTYGFFSEHYKLEYHRDNLPLDKKNVTDLIMEFINKSREELNSLSDAHIESSKDFNMEQCSFGFSQEYTITSHNLKYSAFSYSISEAYFKISGKLTLFDRYS